MLIDPFTTLAQIVNFLVLVALLKHFLYRPIMAAMEQREKKIATRFQQAENREILAQEEIERYQQKQKDWDAKKNQRLKLIEQEVNDYRQALLKVTKTAIEKQQKQWAEALEKEQNVFILALRQKASQQVIKLAQKILTDLASVTLEEQIIGKFQEKLQHFRLDLDKNSPLTIHSTFPISESLQIQLYETIQRHCSEQITLNFEQSSQGICGIELRTSSYKIAWNIQQYLDELETEMKQLLTSREVK
jgi:F-type H+-transporting ATPase subunit b